MQFKKEDVWTIPNILTYIRLICLPIFIAFMSVYCVGRKPGFLITSFSIFIFAEITDIVDGKIARKYNMVTDIGKVLDPIADKLLQCVTILMLAFVANVWFVWTFTSILLVKEIFMGISSKYFMRASKRQIEQMANSIGKAGAVLNFVGIILVFIYCYDALFVLVEKTFSTDIARRLFTSIVAGVLMGACVLQVFAATNYTLIYGTRLKELRASGVLDKLDRYGNPIAKDITKEDNVK